MPRPIPACLAAAWLPLLAACGGEMLPGVQLGTEPGGSSLGFDSLPFEIRRADGRILAGHASVRLLRVEFYVRDPGGLVSCSGGFTLQREHASVPVTAECSDAGRLHGDAAEAWADHGSGTLAEPGGRQASFRYGRPSTEVLRS